MLRLFDAVTADVKKLIAALLFIGVFGLAIGVGMTATSVLATHDDPNTIHACVYTSSGYTQILPPGTEPHCRSNQFLVEWQSGAGFDDLEARIEALETENVTLQERVDELEMHVPECLAEDEVNGDAVFSGCNVQVNNGLESTGTKNSKGNLIIGYNENTYEYDRSGSHNLVVGIDHGYSQWGGLVAGQRNQITGQYSSVSGGELNVANGDNSSVSGGYRNKANGDYSSVGGGELNEANGDNSSVSGGYENKAIGDYSSVTGGESNEAIGVLSSVSGGYRNKASGFNSSVSGGEENEASSYTSSVSGGFDNEASGDYSSVSGGANRTATGTNNWAAGSLSESN